MVILQLLDKLNLEKDKGNLLFKVSNCILCGENP